MPTEKAISSPAILALKSSLTAPIDDRLRIVKQSVCAAEDGQIKNTDRLCKAIREVIGSVLDSPEANADELSQANKLKARLQSLDPRRARAAKKKGTAELNLAEICSSDAPILPSDSDADGADPWFWQPPLPAKEIRRLLEVERNYEAHVNGSFRLKPGADSAAFLKAVFDGRPLTVQALLQLHKHLVESFGAGGPFLAQGAVFETVEKILREQGALPAPIPPNDFGTRLMQELRDRCPD